MSWFNQLMRIEMMLQDVLYLSYHVPTEVVRPLVPEVLPLAVIGGDKTFISVVILKCRHVHATFCPFPRFNYEQVNIRTYVKDPKTGAPAVYFIRSAVTSPVVSALTRTMGLFWEPAGFHLDVSISPDNRNSVYAAAGNWQSHFSLKAEKCTPLPSSGMPPFADVREAMAYLIQPMTGFFGKGDHVKGFHIRHPEMVARTAELREISFPLVTDLGLLQKTDMQNPHSVFYVPQAKFYIYLPPKAVLAKESKKTT